MRLHLPADDQSALVEAVSKSGIPFACLQALGVEVPPAGPSPIAPADPPIVPFTPESELYRAIDRRIAAFDFEALARRAIAEGIDRARGRV